MSKTLTKQKEELTEKVDQMQISADEKKFEIKIEDRKMIKTLM